GCATHRTLCPRRIGGKHARWAFTFGMDCTGCQKQQSDQQPSLGCRCHCQPPMVGGMAGLMTSACAECALPAMRPRFELLSPVLTILAESTCAVFDCGGAYPPPYDPGGCPCGPIRDALPMPKAEYVRKLPTVPWKNWADNGGTETINTVSNKPIPPCSRARLEKPSAPEPVKWLMRSAAQRAAATLTVSLSTMEQTTHSVAMENRVPMPESNHWRNSSLVGSKIRQEMNSGARPM